MGTQNKRKTTGNSNSRSYDHTAACNLGGRLLEADEQRLSVDSEQYRQRFTELAQSGRLVTPRFGTTTDSRHSTATYSEDSSVVGDGGNITSGANDAAATVGNIIQITVATFVELAVQPHQIRISSGGGGSDRGNWNDKDKYRPRRRR